MKHDNMKMTIHDSGETNARCECGWEATFPPGDESMEATLYSHGTPEPPYPQPTKYGLIEDAAQRVAAATLRVHGLVKCIGLAGEWGYDDLDPGPDAEPIYKPSCNHNEWDHPSHFRSADGYEWLCAEQKYLECSHCSTHGVDASPCATLKEIQRALTTPNYLEENGALDPPM